MPKIEVGQILEDRVVYKIKLNKPYNGYSEWRVDGCPRLARQFMKERRDEGYRCTCRVLYGDVESTEEHFLCQFERAREIDNITHVVIE